jgi:anti-anti-sigma factor
VPVDEVLLMLSVKIDREEEYIRVRYYGDTIDLVYGPLTEVVELIKLDNKKLLIDLDGIEYFTSAGISALLATDKIARNLNARIAFVLTHSGIHKIIERTGLQRLLPCFMNEYNALCYLKSDCCILEQLVNR